MSKANPEGWRASLPAVRFTPQFPCGDSSVFALRAAASAAVALRHAAAAAALKGEPVFLASRGLPPLRGEVGEQSEPGGVECTGLPAVQYHPSVPLRGQLP